MALLLRSLLGGAPITLLGAGASNGLLARLGGPLLASASHQQNSRSLTTTPAGGDVWAGSQGLTLGSQSHGMPVLQRRLWEDRSRETFGRLAAPAAGVMGPRQDKDEEGRRAPSLNLPVSLASVASLTPARSSNRRLGMGMGGSPLLPSRRTQLPTSSVQARSWHSYTPQQRYWVEGQEVIDHELNRAFQFTGLDSNSYAPLLICILTSTILGGVMTAIPYVFAPTRVDLDKASAYECGFDAFGEARQTFSMSFYLVAIMYLLFDIEMVFLFPYVLSYPDAKMYWMMNLFLAFLFVGFMYEWSVGALEWTE